MIEATGTFENNFVQAARKKGLPVVVCNHSQVKVAAGKPKKVAMVACIRKQLIILNAMMRNGTYWDENMI